MTEPHTEPVPESAPESAPEDAVEHAPALSEGDLEALDDILDELRARLDETPQWEFCDGFLTALVCSRRAIPATEYLPMLLGDGEPVQWPADAPLRRLPMFLDMDQQTRFLALWQRRWDEVALALDTQVEALDDPRTLEPEVMDVRGALLALPEAERPTIEDGEVPSFAQVWALGFMFAVENWPEDWAPPREREHAQWLDDALDSIVALTEDDTGKATINMYSEDGAPSVSDNRVELFGEAIWAVYDLRQLWKSLGPRVETIRKVAEPGRNDPCHCGSGKKFKKCHGA